MERKAKSGIARSRCIAPHSASLHAGYASTAKSNAEQVRIARRILEGGDRMNF
jgi:hypothetical protein